MLVCLDMRTGAGCRTVNDNHVWRCQSCQNTLRFALTLHNPGTMVGRYRIEGVIEIGAYGVLYEATEPHQEQTAPLTRFFSRYLLGNRGNTEPDEAVGQVTLKEIFDLSSMSDFEREFNVLSGLDHANLSRYLDMFEWQGHIYLVMDAERMVGQSLQEILHTRTELLPESQVLGYALQLCDVLAYLHSQQPPILHGDIQPANIRLTPEGRIKFVDFGLYKMGGHQTRATIHGLSTRAYAPIEHYADHQQVTDLRSDIYSLGATLYHLLSGQEPLSAPHRLASDNDPLLPLQLTLSYVSFAVMKAMSLMPKERFANISDFRQALTGRYEFVQETREDQPRDLLVQIPLAPSDGRELEEHELFYAEQKESRQDESVPEITVNGKSNTATQPSPPQPPSPNNRRGGRKQEKTRENSPSPIIGRRASGWGVRAVSGVRVFPVGEITVSQQARKDETLREVPILLGFVSELEESDSTLEIMESLPEPSSAEESQEESVYQEVIIEPEPEPESLTQQEEPFEVSYLQTSEVFETSEVEASEEEEAFIPRQPSVSTLSSIEKKMNGWILNPIHDHEVTKVAAHHGLSLPHLICNVAGEMRGLGFTLSGKQLIGATKEGQIYLWRVSDGYLEKFLSVNQVGELYSFAVSPDGRTMAASSEDLRVRIWRIADGQLLHQLSGHHKPVMSLSYTANGKLLASASEKSVHLWRVADGKSLDVYKKLKPVAHVAINPDGEMMAVCHKEGYLGIQLWRLQGRKNLQKLETSRFNKKVAWSPDGQLLAADFSFSELSIWHGGGQYLKSLKGHGSQISDIAWHPSGKIIATGSHDDTIRLWSLDEPSLLYICTGHTRDVKQVAISPDGKTLASGAEDSTLRLWQLPKEYSIPVRTRKYLADQQQNPPLGTVQVPSRAIVEGRTKQIEAPNQRTFPHIRCRLGGELISLAYSADGKTILCANNDYQIYYLRASDGKIQKTITLPARLRLDTVAFGPDGETIATASQDTIIRIWRHNGQLLYELRAHHGQIAALAYHPDGKSIASAGRTDGRVCIWSLADGRLLHLFEGDLLVSLAYRPDGRMIAYGSNSGSKNIELRNLETGKKVPLALDGSYHAYSLAWSPNGQRLAGGRSYDVFLWSTTSGKRIQEFDANLKRYAPIRSVAFHPNGKTVASGGENTQICIYSLSELEALYRWRAHPNGVTCMAYSPDGRVLASGGKDGTVRLWQLEKRSGKKVIQQPSVSESLSEQKEPNADFNIVSQPKQTQAGVRRLPPTLKPYLILNASHDLIDLVVDPTRTMIFAITNERIIYQWHVMDGQLLAKQTLPGQHRLTAAAISLDTRLIAASSKGVVQVWQRQGMKLLFEFREHRGYVQHLAFQPDGNVLAGTVSGKLWFWQMSDGQLLCPMKRFSRSFQRLLYSPDGKKLVGKTASTFNVLDAATGQPIHKINPIPFLITWHPDGRFFAGCGNDCQETIYIWQADGKIVNKFEIERRYLDAIKWMATPTSSLIAVSRSNYIQLWDPTNGNLRHICTVDNSTIDYLDSALNGQVLVSAGSFAKVYLWRL